MKEARVAIVSSNQCNCVELAERDKKLGRDANPGIATLFCLVSCLRRTVLGQLDARYFDQVLVLCCCAYPANQPLTSDTQPWGAEPTWAIFGAAGSLDKVLTSGLIAGVVA